MPLTLCLQGVFGFFCGLVAGALLPELLKVFIARSNMIVFLLIFGRSSVIFLLSNQDVGPHVLKYLTHVVANGRSFAMLFS